MCWRDEGVLYECKQMQKETMAQISKCIYCKHNGKYYVGAYISEKATDIPNMSSAE